MDVSTRRLRIVGGADASLPDSRALLKNLLVQHALFSSFIFTIHMNLLKSGATVAPLVSRSEARVVARLAGLSKDIETLQVGLSPHLFLSQ